MQLYRAPGRLHDKAVWFLVGNGGIGYGDYYRGPSGTTFGIHSPGNPGLADDLILETGWVWALPQTLTLSLKP